MLAVKNLNFVILLSDKEEDLTSMLKMATTKEAITSGIKEIAEALGGGIRQGSLVFIEGESKTGKSILSEHLAYGTLITRQHSVAYYVAEQTLDGLLSQMESMSMSVKHDLNIDRLRIYTIGLEIGQDPGEYLAVMAKHFTGLPERFRLVIVDSLTPIMTEADTVVKIDFFQVCKEICSRQKRSIILVMGTHLLEKRTLSRAYAMSDYYLKLKSKDVMIGKGQLDERVMRILEVTKLGGAERLGQEGINFEIKPKIGIQILPFVTIKA